MTRSLLCSFFSIARRTNQEAPPLLSGFLARRLASPSGAAELAALKQSSPVFLGRLASSRPDKGGLVLCDPTLAALHKRHFTGPRRLGHSALDAESMNTGRRIVLCGPTQEALSGPRIECGVTWCASRCGVTTYVITRYDAVSPRTYRRASAIRPSLEEKQIAKNNPDRAKIKQKMRIIIL